MALSVDHTADVDETETEREQARLAEIVETYSREIMLGSGAIL